MTQKELAYFEDAIGHEENIIKILSKSMESIDDEKIIDFIENEKSLHQTRKEKLISYLEGFNE